MGDKVHKVEKGQRRKVAIGPLCTSVPLSKERVKTIVGHLILTFFLKKEDYHV